MPLNEERVNCDQETASRSGMSHVPSQSEFRAPEVCLAAILDWRTTHGTRWVFQETFLIIYLLKKGYLRHYPVIQRTWHLLIAKVYLELP